MPFSFSERAPRFGRWRPILAAVSGLAALALGWHIGDTFIEDDNFRVVNRDLFRAAQLRADERDEAFEENRFRSVLNLRGAQQGKPWYSLEKEFAAAHGLAHFDVKLSADIVPSTAEMEKLVALMRAPPKPLLIHCNRGADRSGLVAALYLYAVEGRPAAEAGRQLSLLYGHFPWLTSGTDAMDAAWKDFVASHTRS